MRSGETLQSGGRGSGHSQACFAFAWGSAVVLRTPIGRFPAPPGPCSSAVSATCLIQPPVTAFVRVCGCGTTRAYPRERVQSISAFAQPAAGSAGYQAQGLKRAVPERRAGSEGRRGSARRQARGGHALLCPPKQVPLSLAGLGGPTCPRSISSAAWVSLAGSGSTDGVPAVGLRGGSKGSVCVRVCWGRGRDSEVTGICLLCRTSFAGVGGMGGGQIVDLGLH